MLPRRRWLKVAASAISSASRISTISFSGTTIRLIDTLDRDQIAYVPFFPLGGFTPLQTTQLSEIAQRLEVKPMQVALAWLLRRSPNILLIPGTSSLAHLQENLTAATLDLSDSVIGELNLIGKVKGRQSDTGRETMPGF